jgi:hypothetical protein
MKLSCHLYTFNDLWITQLIPQTGPINYLHPQHQLIFFLKKSGIYRKVFIYISFVLADGPKWKCGGLSFKRSTKCERASDYYEKDKSWVFFQGIAYFI